MVGIRWLNTAKINANKSASMMPPRDYVYIIAKIYKEVNTILKFFQAM